MFSSGRCRMECASKFIQIIGRIQFLAMWDWSLWFFVGCSPAMNKSFCCSTSSPALVIGVLDFVHSVSNVVVSHFVFICLDDVWCRTSFHTYLLSVYHLWWDIYYLWPIILVRLFSFLLLSFKNTLNVLESCHLLHMYFANIIFPFCGLTSHSLDTVFCRVYVFNFNDVQLVNFSFMHFGLCLQCRT